jgi:carboxymethylenebutenolidase
MAMQTFDVKGTTRQGYLALPEGGKGPGILVLHAWWGLNDFFKDLCERFAAEGYVAFAPDVHHGKLATTPADAEAILKSRDVEAATATAEAAVEYLRNHPAVTSKKIGAIGFSMGGSFAIELDAAHPDVFAGIVMVYGPFPEWINSKTPYLSLYAENDEFDPIAEMKKVDAANIEVHIYPGVGHWFMESDRPENYNDATAKQAWERSLQFFDRMLK